jgi:hypothetical protein
MFVGLINVNQLTTGVIYNLPTRFVGSSPPSGYAPYPNCWRFEALRPACAPPTIEPTLGVTVNNWHGWNGWTFLVELSTTNNEELTTKKCESMWI